jgi:glyoxylase-like metal-dependent hydrolase (beta-lactamase superfamily II)
MLNIGDVHVQRVQDFMGPAYPSRDLLPDFDPAFVDEHRSWLLPKHFVEETGQVIMSCHGWVVRVGGKTILIDSCIGNGKNRPHSPIFHMASFSFMDNFVAAGISAEEIDYVLCTHLHVDHVGWNTRERDGRWVPTFPNAKYVFSKTEVARLDPKNGADENDLDSRNMFEDSILPILEAKQDLQIEGDHELGHGITIEPTPGHAPGHMMVKVVSQGQEGLFSGDIVHHPIQVVRPEWSSSFCADPEQARKTRRRVLEHATEHRSLLLPAHFAGDHVYRIGASGSAFTCLPAR